MNYAFSKQCCWQPCIISGGQLLQRVITTSKYSEQTIGYGWWVSDSVVDNSRTFFVWPIKGARWYCPWFVEMQSTQCQDKIKEAIYLWILGGLTFIVDNRWNTYSGLTAQWPGRKPKRGTSVPKVSTDMERKHETHWQGDGSLYFFSFTGSRKSMTSENVHSRER